MALAVIFGFVSERFLQRRMADQGLHCGIALDQLNHVVPAQCVVRNAEIGSDGALCNSVLRKNVNTIARPVRRYVLVLGAGFRAADDG